MWILDILIKESNLDFSLNKIKSISYSKLRQNVKERHYFLLQEGTCVQGDNDMVNQFIIGWK